MDRAFKEQLEQNSPNHVQGLFLSSVEFGLCSNIYILNFSYLPDFIFLLFFSCCLNELITMAVGVSESTLVLAAAVATVVKAFLRKENEVTDEFPLSEVSVSHT